MSTVVREDSYVPFSRSLLWDELRDFYRSRGCKTWSQAAVPEWRTANPHLTHCYAQIVLGFWRDAQKRNTGFREPFYIIEIGAGSGRFAYQFLQLFLPMFDALGAPEDRICYVMSDFCEATIQAWRDNPQFQPFVQQGRLDFALFDAETDTGFDLLDSRRMLAPGELAYPPVIIANGIFSCLRQDLFFVEHKKLYEGWLKLEENPTGDEDEETSLPSEQYTLHYQKRPLSNPGYTDTAHMQWLQDYAQSLPACALLFPFKVLALLENLRKLHGRSMLLLSTDCGLLSLADIAGRYEPEWLVNDGVAFPVNYHAITIAVSAAGGKLWHAAPRTRNEAGIIAAIYGAQQEWPETSVAVQNNLQSFNPLDFYYVSKRFRQDAEYFTAPRMLAYLRLSHWDTRTFYEFFPHMKFGGLAKIQQDQWCEALLEVWRMHLPIGEDYDLAFDLGSIAGSMHRWNFAMELFRESLRYKGEQPETLCNMGIANWQLAEHAEAEKYLQQALELWRKEQACWSDQMNGEENDDDDEEGDPIEEHLLDLQEWQIHCRARIGADRLTGEGDIYLSLLGKHHAEALYRYQRNRLLAQQVGVRELESVKDARTWIAQENTSGKIPFAILHPHFGLIGLVVLELPSDTAESKFNCARFYYWIAQDHQNRGFGSQAVEVLQHYAAGLGVDHLFGSAHVDNQKSRRTLEKAGFAQLKFPIDEFDEDEINLVYYQKNIKNSPDDRQKIYQAFTDFIKAFEIPLQLAPYTDGSTETA